MKQQQRRCHQDFEQRLRDDAADIRVPPPPEFAQRVLVAIDESRRGQPESIAHPMPMPARSAGLFQWMLAAAALVMVCVIGWAFGPSTMLPEPGENTLARGSDREPALIRPLRRQTPQVEIDLDAPFRAEMNRLLADAGVAGRALLSHIPLRGEPGAAIEFSVE